MDFSSVRRNETSPLTAYKTLNYGDCILENRQAHGLGMNERIFLNTKGQISEGTVSNIFFVRSGKLYTPDLSCGLLPGILPVNQLGEWKSESREVTNQLLKKYESI